MRFFTRSLRALTLAGCLAVLASTALGQSLFIRMTKPTKTVEVLETKAQKFTPSNGEGPAVWLVGVAHVGKAEYYKDIQKLLDEQSLVMYEGVKRKDVDPAKKSEEGKKNSTYQVFSDTLGLQFQLNSIDYSKLTFKNSDLSWEEMDALEKKSPPKAGGPNLSMIGGMLDPTSPQGKMVAGFFASIKDDPSSCEAMRLVMVEALSTPGAIDKALSPELSALLIKSRNEKVISDLQEELKISGRKSIAIFYGAGHMGDMETRLTALGYKGGEERWFKAIQGDTSKVTGNGKMILDMARAQFGKKGG